MSKKTTDTGILLGTVYRPKWLSQEENLLLPNTERTACILGIPCLIRVNYNYRSIDWEQLTCGSETQDFLDTIQECFLTQHVDKPTHKDNLLDLVMT